MAEQDRQRLNLELAKLEAEIASLRAGARETSAFDPELTSKKLKAEIENLAASSKETQSLSPAIRSWIATAVSLLAVIAAVAGAITSFGDYLELRERELDFTVTKEMITLSTQLASETTIEMINAALLLSAYEDHAVPILVANLRTQNDELSKQLIYSLGVVLEKSRVQENPQLVLHPLAQGAKQVIEEQQRLGKPDLGILLNYVDAMLTLGAETNDAQTLSVLQKMKEQLVQESFFDDKDEAEALQIRINDAITSVTSTGP